MAETLDPRYGTAPKVVAGALAGPESAAEHLRNALMILDQVDWDCVANDDGTLRAASQAADIQAVRVRVAAALAQLENNS